VSSSSVLAYGLSVLTTPVLADKISQSQTAVSLWLKGCLPIGTLWPENTIPDHPARPEKPSLVEAREIQNPKRTAKTFGLGLNTVLLHNVAHIELTAVDMYWDTLLRFLPSDPSLATSVELQREFCGDFLAVISDEARHLEGALKRLHALGAEYGMLPCHKSLWDIGFATRLDLASRLALVPLVQEARGLDAGPRFVEQLSGANDNESAKLMQMIYEEEIRHVGAGMKWFRHVANSRGHTDIDLFFHTLVRSRKDHLLMVWHNFFKCQLVH